MSASTNKETSCSEAFSRFLSDEDFHDVKLKGSDGVEISANRYVLAVRSAVFKAMLLGKFSEGSKDVILIEEYEGSVLRAVVEYIHIDEPHMLSTKKRKAAEGDCHTTAEQIHGLVSLAAASKYFDLPGLAEKVKESLFNMLTESSYMSFCLLEACNQQGPSIPADLGKMAWSRVRNSSKFVGNIDAVACLSKKTLQEILKDESTNMTEYELFCLVLSWVECNPDARKTDAESLVQLIKLEGISPDHLTSDVEPSGLATPEQLLRAYRTHSMAAKDHISVEKSRREASLPVWSNTSSQECTNSKNLEKFGLLQCAPIISGVYEWTLERLGDIEDDVGFDLGFGVVLNKVSLDLDLWLTEQKGAYVFQYGHPHCDGEKLQKYNDWSFGGKDQVTLTLDLRPNQEGNGTLSGCIQKMNGKTVETGLIKNLLEHMVDNCGFVPAAEAGTSDGFRLINFQKLLD